MKRTWVLIEVLKRPLSLFARLTTLVLLGAGGIAPRRSHVTLTESRSHFDLFCILTQGKQFRSISHYLFFGYNKTPHLKIVCKHKLVITWQEFVYLLLNNLLPSC